jgi:hypothetical protein
MIDPIEQKEFNMAIRWSINGKIAHSHAWITEELFGDKEALFVWIIEQGREGLKHMYERDYGPYDPGKGKIEILEAWYETSENNWEEVDVGDIDEI